MKTLIFDGIGGSTVLIKSSANGRRFRKYDSFPSHGFLGPDPSVESTFSGVFFIYTSWVLKDSDTYIYVSHLGGDPVMLQNFINIWTAFQVKGYPGNWEGEGYNFMQRQTETLKFTEAGYIDWNTTH